MVLGIETKSTNASSYELDPWVRAVKLLKTGRTHLATLCLLA